MIETGTLLQDRFLVEERIGEGGMGAVYRAIDQKFGSLVAIKETFYGDAELGEAFEREARLLNGLHHPIFPHVSDHFSENGGHFLVMEYIEGDDMSALLKRGELFTLDEVMRWTLDLLDGLDYLHSQDPPIVHRDIKPNNLKLTSRGNIVLLDFGMAKEAVSNTQGMRSVFGYSRRYSPLEQIEGTGTDARSDIFSLGATVFHLLTGQPPIDVLRRASAIVSGRRDPLQLANEIRPDVPESVAAIIHSALALSPEQRFVSARAMGTALEYALGLDSGLDADQIADDAVVPAAVVSPGIDFPALDAYKAEAEAQANVLSESSHGTQEAFPVEEDPLHAEADARSHGDLLSAPLMEPLPNAGEVLDRAVIHLTDADADDGRAETSGLNEISESSADEIDESEIVPEVTRPQSASILSSLTHRRLGSTGVLWLILLSALCAGVVILGISRIARQEPSAAEPVAETSPEEPAAAASPATELIKEPVSGGGTDSPDVDTATTREPNADDRAASDTELGDTDADVPGSSVKPQANNTERRRPEVLTANEPVTRKAQTRDLAPSASHIPRRSTRAERPRVVVSSDLPSVVTIESIFTGIPADRRRRGRDRWVTNDDYDYDEEFRRRMRRIRRENRRPFPF